MKRTLIKVFASLAAVCCSTSFAQPVRADRAAEIARLVQPLVDGEAIVGCAVGIIDGETRKVHGFGEIVRGGETPRGDTLYEIGSVTKALTGTLLADMVLRGEVRLDQPISELVPEGTTAPAFAADQPITLVHLASHASGLPRLPDNMAPAAPTDPYADYTSELMFAFLSGHKLARAPGQYEYSNYGAGLLGQLLARRAGMSYEQLLRERLLDPLAMNDTALALTAEQAPRLAPPYDASLEPGYTWHFDAEAPAGGLHSTVDDMLKLLAAAIDDGESEVTQALRLAGEKQVLGPGWIGVGLGWHIARDGRTRWHNGQTGAYSSYMAYVADKKLAVVVLCNTPTDLTTVLGERIMQSLLGMQVEPPAFHKAVAVDAATLEKYVGVYELAPTFAITVTLEDGQLMAQATGQDKFPIFPESATEFFYKVVDAQISFVVGDDGTVEKLVLHQNGADMPAARAKPGP